MTYSGFQGEACWRHEAGCAIWSDDGASCTCAAGRSEAEDTNRCENCKTPIPENKWCCDACFGLYDGERFHND